ncbi:MAG TPA: EamA family transporter [Candidatus Dojkabacteria bacterium]|nr:EamA family transporter [Candidatus Dojkabacteria bacterium]HRO64672.1 EamA family transporter [Candidatus Dojkabacteria bacterium]HRP36546.1 EamA family transporter [Candidatus Dojkabacteria bacterium]HRP51019.1 EamA family transporter [Candidatus Dojkabacteria bacterium]
MNWLFFITLSVITGSLGSILQRVLMKNKVSGSYAYSALTQVISAIVCLVIAFIIGSQNFPTIEQIFSNNLYLFILFSSILYALHAVFGFKALQSVEVSRFTVIYSLRAVITILVATLFLDEKLTIIQLFGALLILSAIVFLNTTSIKGLFKFTRGEIYALLAAVTFGVATVSDKYLLDWFDYVPYLFVDFIVPGMILFLARPKSIPESVELLKEKLGPKILLFSTLYAIAAITFFAALTQADNASLVSGVGQVGSIVTVLLGIVLLKERKDLSKKLIAASLSFIGLILLVIK